MAGGIRHPFTRALYEPDGDGIVRVTEGERWGRFRADGRWVEGEVYESDPELCLWLSMRRITKHHRLSRQG